jgi:Helix-turn-helix domain
LANGSRLGHHRAAEDLVERNQTTTGNGGDSALQLRIDPAQMGPLVRQIVTETLNQVESDRAKLPDKLAFGEPEAARLLGLKQHQLRDARLAGKIQCSQITGRRIRYMRQDLLDYLTKNRWEQGG